MEEAPPVDTNYDYSDEAFKQFIIDLGDYNETVADNIMVRTRGDEHIRHLWYKSYGNEVPPPEIADEHETSVTDASSDHPESD